MADIELVVKISEKVYRYAKKYNGSSMLTLREKEIGMCMNAIANGTPLPKGHGELVYGEDVCNELRYMDNNGCITRSVNHVIEDIKKGVPTIIEADKKNKK